MTQQTLECEILYGLEESQKKFARYRIASQKCILLFHTVPPPEFDDANLEQGLLTHEVNYEVFFLRLDLSEIKEVLKLDKQNPTDSTLTDHWLEVRETDGQKHYLLMPSADIRDEWVSHLQPSLGKLKSPLSQSIPITGISPHQPLVIGNASAKISCESASSSDSDTGEERSSVILKGNPQDYPALANWSTSLIRYGYGYKKGAKRKNWKYRFFVLTLHSFAYFESEKKKNPIASFPIDNIRSIFQRKDLSGHDFVMAIETDDRMHLWEFETEEELRKWLKDFTEHLPLRSLKGPRVTQSQKIPHSQLSPSSSLKMQSTGPPTSAPSPPSAHHNIVTSLPANLSTAVDPAAAQSGIVFEVKVFDGVVMKKQVVRNSNQKADSDSDESAGEESSAGAVVSKSARALQGVDGVLVKFGYCQKEGGVVHNWKRRFFILTKSTLYYFKSASEAQPIRSIKVNTITSVLELLNYQGRNHVIVVNTHSRNYYIECGTPHQSKGWIEDIQKCIEYQDRFKPTTSAASPSDVLDQDELSLSPAEDRILKVVAADGASLKKSK